MGDVIEFRQPTVVVGEDHSKHEGGMQIVNGVMWPCLDCWVERAGSYHAIDWAAFDAATARGREAMLGKSR
jgi:hypothetical protein